MKEPTILVVDDEPSISEVVSIYLRRAGFQVVVAQDGQRALDALEKELPDLVVLDLMLPKMDGLEITRRLRAEGDTPIIMLTAKGQEKDRETGKSVGADVFLTKPCEIKKLLAHIKELTTDATVPSEPENILCSNKPS